MRLSRSAPCRALVAIPAVAVAALGATACGDEVVTAESLAPASAQPAAADTPTVEAPESTRTGGDDVTELNYGEGTLQVPRPPVPDLADAKLSSVLDEAHAAKLGNNTYTTVRFDLPVEKLPGAFMGSVVVTVLPSSFVDSWGGDGAEGIDRARSTASPVGEIREIEAAGVPALFVPQLDVNPGARIGYEDRISSQLIWTQEDGSVAQLISDLMSEAELIRYAESIIGASS